MQEPRERLVEIQLWFATFLENRDMCRRYAFLSKFIRKKNISVTDTWDDGLSLGNL